jgi:hypothetical protein
MESVNKPKCPENPDHSVMDGRVPGSDERFWFCLVCVKKLGPAPWRDTDKWESFEVHR